MTTDKISTTDGGAAPPPPQPSHSGHDHAATNGPTDAPRPPSAPAPKPRIGDSRPAPPTQSAPAATKEGGGSPSGAAGGGAAKKRRRRRGKGGSGQGGSGQGGSGQGGSGQGGSGRAAQQNAGGQQTAGGRNGGRDGREDSRVPTPVEAVMPDSAGKKRRRRKSRGGDSDATGRYQMNVHVDSDGHTHIAVLEGRHLVEYQLSRAADDIAQIYGNIYMGRVENVLPGMEAAFVDIATPKNAVLYQGDVQYDAEELDLPKGQRPRIEDVLSAKQLILCQVTKNPIAHKGARLTQEVSLAGRHVVLVPNSKTYGISKRLPDKERKRLRSVLDRVKPAEHGVIVRTAAQGVKAEELESDLTRLLEQWRQISELAHSINRPALVYREPAGALRVIREEFSNEFRRVLIDDRELFDQVRGYVASISPQLADRVTFYDRSSEPLPLFERYHVLEQLQRALDRKVWLPSGGSLIIEHTEALTVIDVNTGRNVGSSSLEETVFHNNLEAAEEIARQLRLRDIGGIIVVDFVDMEIKENREQLVRVFKDALARDKTRTQVYSVSDLGLVEMTRKRIGEGLLESFSAPCDECDHRGVVLDHRIDGLVQVTA